MFFRNQSVKGAWKCMLRKLANQAHGEYYIYNRNNLLQHRLSASGPQPIPKHQKPKRHINSTPPLPSQVSNNKRSKKRDQFIVFLFRLFLIIQLWFSCFFSLFLVSFPNFTVSLLRLMVSSLGAQNYE